eukprot:6082099-Amphidinium_carterae.1
MAYLCQKLPPSALVWLLSFYPYSFPPVLCKRIPKGMKVDMLKMHKNIATRINSKTHRTMAWSR